MLFVMPNPAYVRNFESIFRALGSRSWRVTVLFEGRKPTDAAALELMEELCSEFDTLRYEMQPPLLLGFRGVLRLALRAAQDYLRYFEAPYGDASRLRARAVPASMPSGVERALAAVLHRLPRVRRTLASLARRGDEQLGTDRAVKRELERRRPEVLVVVPMLQFRSRQGDWVRAAQALGIATTACVYGWDHFTNKGLMHAQPDRVAVWNDAQRTEAMALHGVDPGSIIVTGAWPYDYWLGAQASGSREDFCRRLGVPGDRPLILYACSSRFIAGQERPAVLRWLQALRSAGDSRLADATVILRPHHSNPEGWGEPTSADLPGVVVFPPNGADPVDERSRADYIDSIIQADAVVGVNTSAMVESALGDTPALAYPAPIFRASQEELPHFHHLIGEAGFVEVSGSMTEHLEKLATALAAPSDPAPRQVFVDAFLRPGGSEPTPTERVVALLEGLLTAGGVTSPKEANVPG